MESHNGQYGTTIKQFPLLDKPHKITETAETKFNSAVSTYLTCRMGYTNAIAK